MMPGRFVIKCRDNSVTKMIGWYLGPEGWTPSIKKARKYATREDAKRDAGYDIVADILDEVNE